MAVYQREKGQSTRGRKGSLPEGEQAIYQRETSNLPEGERAVYQREKGQSTRGRRGSLP